MAIFDVKIYEAAIKLLIAFAVVFFLVFAFLCWKWSYVHEKRERAVIAWAVPLIYSFKVFMAFALFLAILYLLLEYFKSFQLPPV